jgi:hypothetical protein
MPDCKPLLAVRKAAPGYNYMRHPERNAAKSKDPVALLLRFHAGSSTSSRDDGQECDIAIAWTIKVG